MVFHQTCENTLILGDLEFVSCLPGHQYFGTRYARWAIKTTHMFCFQTWSVHGSTWLQDFRRLLSSVRFSRTLLDWHKWITHTKYHQSILILWYTGSHANPVKSLVSHDEFSHLFSLYSFPFRKKPELAQEQLTTYCRDQYKRFFQLVPGLDSREISVDGALKIFEVAEKQLQRLIVTVI